MDPALLLLLLLAVRPPLAAVSGQIHMFRLGSVLGGERAPEQREALELARKRLLYSTRSAGSGQVSIISLPATKRPLGNDLELKKEVCRLLSLPRDHLEGPGVAAIIGSLADRQTQLLESTCSRFKVPLLRVDEDSLDLDEAPSEVGDANVSLNLRPTTEDLGRAMVDFVRTFGWTEFAVIHESPRGWRKQKDVLNEVFSWLKGSADEGKTYDVSVHDIMDEDYAAALTRLKSARDQHRHFIVDIATAGVGRFLESAQDLGMLGDNRHFMFTSLDLAALSISKYCVGGVNVTGYSIVNTTSREAAQLIEDWHTFQGKTAAAPALATTPRLGQHRLPKLLLETNVALVIDAANIFANAIAAFPDFNKGRSLTTALLHCNSSSFWNVGSQFYDILRSRVHRGLSGEIRFDKHGRRIGVKLSLIGYDVSGKLEEVGHWTAAKGLQITEPVDKRNEEIRKGLGDRRLRVVVKKEEPFVMVERKDNGQTVYRGYCIDLLQKLSDYLNFTYEIHVVGDGKTGNIENGTWNGMIGELVRGDADLAVASLSVTAERSAAIDFTAPFMHLGISILFKKPSPIEPDMFSFLRPLHFEIWICIMGAMLAFAITMFLFARFGPYEWKNTHPCHPEVKIIENEFTLANSFWFVLASFLQQGSEEAPKAGSLRVIAGVWGFFCMIMVSSYTANLAAFLTVSRMKAPIENARDLSKQTEIKYGCYSGGATERFFQKSSIAIYQAMWNFMEANKDEVMLDSNAGVMKVLEGNYAYLMESVPLRYQLTQHCDLMEIGHELDSKFYGIGLPKGSPYTNLFSVALVNLSDAQVLSELYNKWWMVGSSPCGNDNVKPDIISQSQLGVGNFGGLYIFLSAGVALSFVVAIFEFFIANSIKARQNKVPACNHIGEECCFALRCCSKNKKYVVSADDDVDEEAADAEEEIVHASNEGRKTPRGAPEKASKSNTHKTNDYRKGRR